MPPKIPRLDSTPRAASESSWPGVAPYRWGVSQEPRGPELTSLVGLISNRALVVDAPPIKRCRVSDARSPCWNTRSCIEGDFTDQGVNSAWGVGFVKFDWSRRVGGFYMQRPRRSKIRSRSVDYIPSSYTPAGLGPRCRSVFLGHSFALSTQRRSNHAFLWFRMQPRCCN